MAPLAWWLRPALVPASLIMLVMAGLGVDDRAVEASIEQIRAAVAVSGSRPGLSRLSSLRQLRDASMRPLFFELAQHDDPRVGVHAILALGEIDAAHRIDPWLLSRLKVPEAQYAVVAHALAGDLLDVEGIRDLEATEGVGTLRGLCTTQRLSDRLPRFPRRANSCVRRLGVAVFAR